MTSNGSLSNTESFAVDAAMTSLESDLVPHAGPYTSIAAFEPYSMSAGHYSRTSRPAVSEYLRNSPPPTIPSSHPFSLPPLSSIDPRQHRPSHSPQPRPAPSPYPSQAQPLHSHYADTRSSLPDYYGPSLSA